MTRQQMREQKAKLRALMKQRRAEARAKLDAIPAVREARRKRRIRQLIGLAVLLLLALFFRCDCTPEPPKVVEAPVADAGTPAEPKPDAGVKVKQKPLTGKLDTQPRGKYGNDSSATPSWLDEYRLQVAARSPRLAECFTGSEKPGALRWSASVNAVSGAVSDHGLEPVGPGPSVQDSQRECILGVLSNPRYKLNVPKEEAEQQKLPRRISIVIEF